MGFSSLNSSTQIVPCITGNENDALDLRSFLKTKGIIAPAIRPPTVPESTARIRFSIHLGLDNDQLDYVLRHIYEWKTRHENR